MSKSLGLPDRVRCPGDDDRRVVLRGKRRKTAVLFAARTQREHTSAAIREVAEEVSNSTLRSPHAPARRAAD